MTNERGFSLSELLVALVLIAMIMTGLWTIQQQGQQAYLFGQSRVEAQQNARVALDRLTTELRSATSITTATSCDTGSNDITFVDQNGTSLRYDLSGTNLRRYVSTATPDADSVVIGSVVSLTLTCYASDGTTATATAASIRSIKISITSKTDEANASYTGGNQYAVMETRVRLRNL
jgi:prepilin-type N-terminal cleavage/methylation domain-containing protein